MDKSKYLIGLYIVYINYNNSSISLADSSPNPSLIPSLLNQAILQIKFRNHRIACPNSQGQPTRLYTR